MAAPTPQMALDAISIQTDLREALSSLLWWKGELGQHLHLIDLSEALPSTEEVGQLGLSASNWLDQMHDLLDRIRPFFEVPGSSAEISDEDKRRLQALHVMDLLMERRAIYRQHVDLAEWLQAQLANIPITIVCQKPIEINRLNEAIVFQMLLPVIREMENASGSRLILRLTFVAETREVMMRLEHAFSPIRAGTLWSDRLGDLAFAHVSHNLQQLGGTLHLDKAAPGDRLRGALAR